LATNSEDLLIARRLATVPRLRRSARRSPCAVRWMLVADARTVWPGHAFPTPSWCFPTCRLSAPIAVSSARYGCHSRLWPAHPDPCL